jgi:Holliday junction resolvasome RuvABC ATP-dependent DNA helicase subunit
VPACSLSPLRARFSINARLEYMMQAAFFYVKRSAHYWPLLLRMKLSFVNCPQEPGTPRIANNLLRRTLSILHR